MKSSCLPFLFRSRTRHTARAADSAWLCVCEDDKPGAAPSPRASAWGGDAYAAPLPYVAVDADDKGSVSTGVAADAASLAADLHTPERDVRLLLPAGPGAPPPPSLVAARGRTLLVGLEGVRAALSPSRAVILAAPASPHGALDGGGAPRPDAPLVAALARAARAHGSSASFLAAALDACLATVVASLEARAAAVAIEAAAAADALASGRPTRPQLARLHAAKRALSDAAAAARRVTGALRPRRVPTEVVAAALAAAARRADAAAATVADAAAGLRGAEACARMVNRRRAWLLYC